MYVVTQAIEVLFRDADAAFGLLNRELVGQGGDFHERHLHKVQVVQTYLEVSDEQG